MVTVLLEFLYKNWLAVLLAIVLSVVYMKYRYAEHELLVAQTHVVKDKSTIENLTYDNGKLEAANHEYFVDVKKQNDSLELLKQQGTNLQTALDEKTRQMLLVKTQNQQKITNLLNANIRASDNKKGVTCKDAMVWGAQQAKDLGNF